MLKEDISKLVTNNALDTKTEEVENKIPNHDVSENFAERLKQAKLASKNDMIIL